MSSETQTGSARESCAAALGIVAQRDFRKWSGLPRGCLFEDLTPFFPPLNDGVGLSILGRVKRQFRIVVGEGYQHNLRVWLDGDGVMMLDAQLPAISPALPELLQALGEPEEKLDIEWGGVLMERAEWVYAGRGISLVINPRSMLLLHLSLFPPSTLDTYLNEFRLSFSKRPFQKGRS